MVRGGHFPVLGKAASLLPLLVFVRLVHPVLLTGMLLAQGALLPQSLPLECDFYGVAAAVFFLLHPLQHRHVCEFAWELIGRSVWECSCESDCWLLVCCFFFFELEEEEKAPFAQLIAGFSSTASTLRPLQHFMCTLSHCSVRKTSFRHFSHP